MTHPTGSKSVICTINLSGSMEPDEASDSDVVERAKADRLTREDEDQQELAEQHGENNLARWQKMKRDVKEKRSRDGVADQTGFLKT